MQLCVQLVARYAQLKCEKLRVELRVARQKVPLLRAELRVEGKIELNAKQLDIYKTLCIIRRVELFVVEQLNSDVRSATFYGIEFLQMRESAKTWR